MRALLVFFAITFAVTWTSWYATGGVDSARDLVLVYLGIFAPGIVALLMTPAADRKRLLGRLFAWRADWRLYAFAIGFMIAIKLAVAVIHRIAFDAWPRFGDTPVLLMFASTIVSTVLLGQAGEELGWRGYALPRLAAHLGFPLAGLLLGVIWALWHLPLFFIAGTTTTGQSFPLYTLQVTALSVAIAWLYVKSGGSLLLTMLMHAAVNNTKDVVPSMVAGATDAFALSSSAVAWLTVGLLWICAASLSTHHVSSRA